MSPADITAAMAQATREDPARNRMGGGAGSDGFARRPGQFGLHVARRLPASLRRARQAALDDVAQSRRQVGEARRLADCDAFPRCHLVKDESQRVNVRTRVGRLAFTLLGRHVSRRAENDVRSCNRLLVCRLGEAKVQHLDAVADQHQIAGLQIPVDDPLVVGGHERIGDLRAERDGVGDGKPAALEPRGQRFTVDQLHHQEIGPDVVQRADMRVVERGDRAGLPFEAAGEVRRGHLDGDLPPETGIDGAVDRAHPARANFVLNAIRPEFEAAGEVSN